jgi:hypothetical protein
MNGLIVRCRLQQAQLLYISDSASWLTSFQPELEEGCALQIHKVILVVRELCEVRTWH